MGKAIKLDTIERAFSVCKRYALMAKKVDYLKNRRKYDLLREKMHSVTWRTLMNEDNAIYLPQTLIYSLITTAVNNGKTKQAVITALEAVGYEIL